MPPLPIALAPGDGIGPEIMAATLEVFRAAGVLDHLEFRPVEMGKAVFGHGDSRGMTDAAIRTVEECGVLFKGPMETPKGGGGKSINVTARKLWSAFANLRVFKTLPGVETVYSRAGIPIDLCIVRENIEDTYGGIEHRLTADVIHGKRLISAPGCDQVHRFAFQTAARMGLKSVHCSHKANIMKMTDGLFLERFRTIAAEYPQIEAGDVIVDALCMNLAVRPHTYQMVVLPNLQGDIVSDLCAGLVGGLGFAPSANIGHHISIFEAVHGTAPDIAGKGLANPTSLILSGLMMLRHVGLVREAAIIENALLATLEDGVHTGDFGDPRTPPVNTAGFTRALVERLGEPPRTVPALAIPEASELSLDRAPKPAQPPRLRTFTGVQTRVVGCDLYLDTTAAPAQLAAEVSALAEGTPFRATMISNRGTQVWPTGSVYTECVDYLRVRLELREPGAAADQGAVLALVSRLGQKWTIGAYELLRTFDGRPGYSLAQGQ